MGRRSARLWLAVLVCLLLTACGGAAEPGRRTTTPRPTPPVTDITPPPPTTTAAPQSRPNVLVIETDDMRTDDLRFMPHVRRLVRDRGLSFENSFAPYPLCCPSRASFLTGEYAHNHHVYSHEDPFGFAAFRDRRTIATVLQGSGYRTGLVGKYLNGYGEQALRPSGRSSLRYVPPGWTRWRGASDHVWSPLDRIHGGTYDYFDLVENVDGRIRSFPGRYTTDVTAAQTRRMTDRFGRGDDPWFVWWTPVAPHHGTPVEPDDPPPSRRTDGFTTTWVTPARPDWVKGRFDREVTHGAGTPARRPAEADVSDKPRFLRNQPGLTAAERDAETAVTRQRAESLFVLDVQVGRTLSRLSENGQLADTIVVFTSDNGYYLGEHRKRQGKINLHEPSLRVPLLMAGPGIPVGRRYDPVTTVDLAPTLAAWAGTRMPRADGTDLGPLIEGGDRGWTRAVVTEGMMPEPVYRARHALGRSPLNTRGLRLGRWKLTRYSTGETELYDLRRDPLELHSLTRDPAYARVLGQLKALFRERRDCAGRQCLAPLPPRWRLTPAANARLTRAQVRATERYYGS